MNNPSAPRLPGWAALLFLPGLFFGGCRESIPSDGDDTFFERQNAAHNGDYLATYPLASPDSCIARVKAEVPAKHQPWACLALWYHLPRTSPALSFRFLDLYEKNYPHDTVSAFAQMMRGEFYVDLAQFDSARTCLSDAYERYTLLNRPLDASDATYLLARSHTYQNNFAAALQSYFEVLDLLNAQDTTFSERHANLYHDIEVAYERSSNRQQQLSWLKKAWNADHSKLDKPWNYKRMVAHALGLYYLKDDPDSSLTWAKLAIDIEEKQLKKSPPSARLVHGLARAYFKKGDCATALPYFQDAWRRNPEKSSLFGYYQYGMALGECYLCVGQLDSAELHLKQALSSPDTGNLAVAHNLLSEVHAKRGDWKSALAEARESRRLFEVKFTADKAKAVADFDARYETAQKERRIAELQQQRKATRLQTLAGVLSLLLALGFVLSLFFRQRARRRMLEQENQLLEQDKELLRQEKQLAEARELLKAQALERSQEDLQTTLEELDSTAQLLALKNLLVEELEMKLTQRHLAPAEDDDSHPAASSSMRSMKILTESDWARFRARFEQNFPGFLHDLKMQFRTLTSAEIRLFLLMKLDFDKKEIAETLGISQESVWRSRHRLTKKLGLPETGDLDTFIREFEQVPARRHSPVLQEEAR